MKRGRKILYPKICGVYKIYIRQYPEYFYIGASKNIYQRFANHKNDFNLKIANKYKRSPFFNFIGKINYDDLKLLILKECNEFHLEFYEQYYISELNPPLNRYKFSGIRNNNGAIAKALAFKDMNKDKDLKKTTFILYTGENQLLNLLNDKLLLPDTLHIEVI